MGKAGDWSSWPMGVITEGIPRVYQGAATPVSLGYPRAVFNKEFTLNGPGVVVQSTKTIFVYYY